MKRQSEGNTLDKAERNEIQPDGKRRRGCRTEESCCQKSHQKLQTDNITINVRKSQKPQLPITMSKKCTDSTLKMYLSCCSVLSISQLRRKHNSLDLTQNFLQQLMEHTHNADQLVAHQHIYQTVRTHHWLQIITDILLLRKNKVTLRSVIGITVLPQCSMSFILQLSF